MNPSSLRILVIAIFILEAGTSTLSWRAIAALRTLVNKSAIGSVTIDKQLHLLILPAGFLYPGQFTVQGQRAEAYAADAEFPYIGPGPSAQLAAVMLLHPVFRGSACFYNLT
jgi:hypothetical protein